MVGLGVRPWRAWGGSSGVADSPPPPPPPPAPNPQARRPRLGYGGAAGGSAGPGLAVKERPRPHAAAECKVCLQAGVYDELDELEEIERAAAEDEEDFEGSERDDELEDDEDRDGDVPKDPEPMPSGGYDSDLEVISCHGDEGEAEEEISDILELNAVTAEGDVEMEITVDSGAGASVINPRDLPGVPLKPSPGSQRGQRYVGPGGEVIANVGQMEPSLRLPNGALGKIVFQGTAVRKPLLAVSDVNKKGNMVVFDGPNSCIVPGNAPELAELRALIGKIRGKVPLQAKNGVYTMTVQRTSARPGGFAQPGAKA